MFLSLLFLRKPPFRTYLPGDTYYFDQFLDHFNTSDNRTFKQRYYYNDTFCQNTTTKKLIVFIGGEAAITERRVQKGAYMKLAKETDSCVVALEHRYFGESQPFEELITPNLKYLTSDQALADLAYFIESFIKIKYQSRPTILVVGGSYPGTLSSYFRMKYPHIADFSWASSPPLYVKNDFWEYDAHCAEVLGKISPKCLTNTKLIYDDFNDHPDHITNYIPFKPSVSHVSQLSILSDFIAGIVQYDNIYKLVTPYCENQNGDSPNYDSFHDYFYKYLEVEGVEDPSDLDDFALTNHSIHTDYADSLSWTWMTCNEFGWFQTASGQLRPAKVDLNYSDLVCRTYFGVGISPDIDNNRSAKMDIYNAQNPATTMIYFSNGKTDPWSVLSVSENVQNPPVGRYSVQINNASHCSDLGDEAAGEPEALTVARKQIMDTMARWLNHPDGPNCSSHGHRVLDGCVCERGYEGPDCGLKVISPGLFKVFDSLVVLLPTLMMIIIGCSAWFLFKKDGEDTEIKTIP
ncbi:Clan SC, family S28, unassigned serine peptidase [Trichomonas vaginalis G3]|uniref:Clan SC, family S28, unassigned serine peptidase n=1 Tax=Trichomonas vaginalis (strain ATCC PRA-98 / G3) TaxID=412133 RepID=A2DLX9_TRIV3|nr:serine-type peptidase protein [Trichomonas vaginalis G3]EAY18582.1 Clan SC, family S28, unassigned serine peptidase [Trichomonas vaginalis G3]KAI5491610.1 serine-type peptidase protein [Trichomonas vaginalis G3]|eukprot:XP_001579568.1 Clan SC, family S28, unassigned serine peptidase [Trichomonas vaginalis G3]